jgi:hypothetical protein
MSSSFALTLFVSAVLSDVATDTKSYDSWDLGKGLIFLCPTKNDGNAWVRIAGTDKDNFINLHFNRSDTPQHSFTNLDSNIFVTEHNGYNVDALTLSGASQTAPSKVELKMTIFFPQDSQKGKNEVEAQMSLNGGVYATPKTTCVIISATEEPSK